MNQLHERKENWYWKQKENQNIVIIPTHDVVHTYLGVSLIKYVAIIPRIILSKKQSGQALQLQPISITISYHN